jgi:aspartate/methionine/tyrosine aminotransferase
MYVIADAFMEKGDEMIVFDPVDFLFQESCKAAGGVPVRFPARVKADGTGLILDDLEEYITPKTKIIGLCNPHNPWGTLYTKEDLKHILDLANKYGLYIMNDEIWSDIVYPEQPFVSINQIDGDKSRVVSVYGFSKSRPSNRLCLLQ